MEEVSHPRARVFTAIKELCTGCGICQLVCSLSKTGRVNPHLARIGLAHSERELSYSPVICRHCKNPPCKLACPVPGAMTWGANGVVVIDDDSCLNCLACVEACPFAAIQVGPDREMLKCDLCGGDPVCVRYCPPRVIYSPSQPLPWPQQSCLQYVEPHLVAVIRRPMNISRKK